MAILVFTFNTIGAPQYVLFAIEYGIFVKPLATLAPIHIPSQPLKPDEAAPWVVVRD